MIKTRKTLPTLEQHTPQLDNYQSFGEVFLEENSQDIKNTEEVTLSIENPVLYSSVDDFLIHNAMEYEVSSEGNLKDNLDKNLENTALLETDVHEEVIVVQDNAEDTPTEDTQEKLFECLQEDVPDIEPNEIADNNYFLDDKEDDLDSAYLYSDTYIDETLTEETQVDTSETLELNQESLTLSVVDGDLEESCDCTRLEENQKVEAILENIQEETSECTTEESIEYTEYITSASIEVTEDLDNQSVTEILQETIKDTSDTNIALEQISEVTEQLDAEDDLEETLKDTINNLEFQSKQDIFYVDSEKETETHIDNLQLSDETDVSQSFNKVTVSTDNQLTDKIDLVEVTSEDTIVDDTQEIAVEDVCLENIIENQSIKNTQNNTESTLKNTLSELFSVEEDNFVDFQIADYLNVQNTEVVEENNDKMFQFESLCHDVFQYISNKRTNTLTEKSDGDILLKNLERQKKAMMGYQAEVSYYLTQIEEYLQSQGKNNTFYPSWYPSLKEAVFHELYGFSGIAEWLYGWRKELETSSSAKIIGDKIYFLVNGEQILQPQTISAERRESLRRTLLLGSQQRDGEGYYEVYTLDGTRISIYGDEYVKDGLDAFIFRKFLVKDFTFEKQAELGMIPKESLPLFKSMPKVGFNVIFSGAVRTGKTTMLTTWQSYEDEKLEGIMIETDPEIPIHKIMPKAPIIQFVVDGEKLENIMKSLLRADGNYIIMAEARDAIAFNIALETTDRGTKRSKLTTHFSSGLDLAYSMANKIVEKYKGSVYETTLRIMKNFNYVFEFIELPNKAQKRLNAIYEHRYDPITHKAEIHLICKYNIEDNTWGWNYSIGEDKREIGRRQNQVAFGMFENALRELAEHSPIKENTVFKPINKEME